MDATEFTGVVGLLERAGRTLDLMWHSAVADGSDAAMCLGEASRSVHRAIIALSSPIGPECQRDVRTVAAR